MTLLFGVKKRIWNPFFYNNISPSDFRNFNAFALVEKWSGHKNISELSNVTCSGELKNHFNQLKVFCNYAAGSKIQGIKHPFSHAKV